MDPYHTTQFMGFQRVSHLDPTNLSSEFLTKRDSNHCSQTPKTSFLASWPICKHKWPIQACPNVQSCQTLHCSQRRDVDEGSGQHLGIKPHHIAAHKLLKTLHLCGPRWEKICLRCLQTTKAQTKHLCFTLIKNIISKLATSEFPIFYLVSKVEETGLSLALSETRRQVFAAFHKLANMVDKE